MSCQSIRGSVDSASRFRASRQQRRGRRTYTLSDRPAIEYTFAALDAAQGRNTMARGSFHNDDRDADPRTAGCLPALRRDHGARRRRLHRQQGRDLRRHRPQRRGQDERLQLHLRPLSPRQGENPLRGQRHHRPHARPPRAPRHGALVPEHRAVQGHDGDRQPDARPAHPHEDRPADRRAVLRPGPARGDPQPRGRRGDRRLPRDPGDPSESRRHAGLRAAKARRAGPGACARTAGAAARRADGRHERRGDRGHGALRPRHQPGTRHHDRADRARHGRGDGHLRPDLRHRLRRQARRGDAGRDPGQPERHQRLPRRNRRALQH